MFFFQKDKVMNVFFYREKDPDCLITSDFLTKKCIFSYKGG